MMRSVAPNASTEVPCFRSNLHAVAFAASLSESWKKARSPPITLRLNQLSICSETVPKDAMNSPRFVFVVCAILGSTLTTSHQPRQHGARRGARCPNYFDWIVERDAHKGPLGNHAEQRSRVPLKNE